VCPVQPQPAGGGQVSTPPSLPYASRADSGDIEFVHQCEGYTDTRVLPTGPDGWTWTDENSIHPSIHCLGCGTHGHWTAGRWVPA